MDKIILGVERMEEKSTANIRKGEVWESLGAPEQLKRVQETETACVWRWGRGRGDGPNKPSKAHEGKPGPPPSAASGAGTQLVSDWGRLHVHVNILGKITGS